MKVFLPLRYKRGVHDAGETYSAGAVEPVGARHACALGAASDFGPGLVPAGTGHPDLRARENEHGVRPELLPDIRVISLAVEFGFGHH